MNVLLLAALTEATGNAVTARRLRAHLAARHKVTLVDATTTDVETLRALVAEQQVDVALGVHALLAGPFLRALERPYALVFGGTDLYEPMHELQQKQMARAVAAAARLVAFSAENRARAEWMWPSAVGRVRCLPQAVELPAPQGQFTVRPQLGLTARHRLVLLPTGIRRVKDPLHVVEAFSRWHQANSDVHLAVAGALLEADYVDGALGTLRSRPGVHFVQALPRPAMLAAIRQADVVINTSLSEGMCGVLLEAMALGTPVIARRNAGNESLVRHGHTGLLYDAPDELVHWVQALLGSGELGERLSATAQGQVAERHSLEVEQAAYLALLEEVFAHRDAPPAPAAPVDELEVAPVASRRLALAAPLHAAVVQALDWARQTPQRALEVRRLSALLATAPPQVALEAIAGWAAAAELPTPSALLLLLALTQVPLAQARLEAAGVDGAVISATLSDLTEWADHLLSVCGQPGLTLETLQWAQRYLRGELLRLGPVQFDLRPFSAPFRVFRQVATGALSAATLEGHRLDLLTGEATAEAAPPYPLAEWTLALEPGMPVLEMWFPGSVAALRLPELAGAIREALAAFAHSSPETAPVAMCGETWRLDPQLGALFPEAVGVSELQRVCHLYPSAISEEKTLRRIFGPAATRATLGTRLAQASTPVQRVLAHFLEDPTRRLVARGGFVLRDEFVAVKQWA